MIRWELYSRPAEIYATFCCVDPGHAFHGYICCGDTELWSIAISYGS
jgi:hypothetical protein